MVWSGTVLYQPYRFCPVSSRPIDSHRRPSVEQLRDCVMTAVIVRADLFSLASMRRRSAVTLLARFHSQCSVVLYKDSTTISEKWKGKVMLIDGDGDADSDVENANDIDNTIVVLTIVTLCVATEQAL